MAKLVRSEVFPGSIDNFRAFMEKHRGTRETPTGASLYIPDEEPPHGKPPLSTQAVWGVVLSTSSGVIYVNRPLVPWATIQAYEQLPGQTLVEFWDGRCVYYGEDADPIGGAFEQLAQMIVEEWSTTPTPIGVGAGEGEAPEPSLPHWFPKTKKTIEKWSRAYSIMVATREKYHHDYREWDRYEPAPKIDDYRDTLAYEMGWKPCGKTVRHIMKAGDNGWLE